MDKKQALEFCNRWLSSWTGNQPQKLIQFYSTNALYIDPANKNGLQGHKQILPYFEKLLAKNPDWQWQAIEVFAVDTGFILKWKATIPIGQEYICEYGLDIVEICGNKITRNEVYFDRSEMLSK